LAVAVLLASWLVSPGQRVEPARIGPQTAQALSFTTVPVFNYARQGYARNLSRVPGSWYVYDALPWAAQQVMLFVGPTRTPPGGGAPQPRTPVPSPTR
jgi:hypothetical protein